MSTQQQVQEDVAPPPSRRRGALARRWAGDGTGGEDAMSTAE